MTVSVNDLLVGPTVLASGVTTISVDFLVADESHIKVYKTGSETPLTLATDYTFSGVGTDSGTVTLTTAANGTDSYAVYLEVPLERTSDMQLRGAFRSGPFNDELDRLWQALQYVNTISERTVRFSKNSANPAAITSEVAADRANKVLTFNASGDPIVSTTLDAGSVVVTPFTETLLDDPDAAAFLTSFGFTATLAELNKLAGLATTKTELGYVNGVTGPIQTQLNGKEAADPDILKADTDDNLEAGFTSGIRAHSVQSGSFTPDPAQSNFQSMVNGGVTAFNAPTASNNYIITMHILNNASAGAMTPTGFDLVTGDNFTTTNGAEFIAHMTKINNKTLLNIQAL